MASNAIKSKQNSGVRSQNSVGYFVPLADESKGLIPALNLVFQRRSANDLVMQQFSSWSKSPTDSATESESAVASIEAKGDSVALASLLPRGDAKGE
ncbi:hypothetical protein A6769_12335 [Nostoc punctiforme NIES-2108]|uniref:Uncharacterized protein n=1 Tax=Nostoc punctiforme NIES-2108 TaxID=1356359 RepID=A0A367RNQ9_NOSPU|nr:hypothetical protein A6769_12335 [Nostoc punctiforme NIES-2108]